MAILVSVYPDSNKGGEGGIQVFDTAELRDFLPISFGRKQYVCKTFAIPVVLQLLVFPIIARQVTNLTDFAHLETILDSVGIREKCYFNTGTVEDDLKMSHSWAGDKINAV